MSCGVVMDSTVSDRSAKTLTSTTSFALPIAIVTAYIVVVCLDRSDAIPVHTYLKEANTQNARLRVIKKPSDSGPASSISSTTQHPNCNLTI